jgi:hypothetical protein
MTKQEVLERLCNLASKVGEEEYKNLRAHDCFCGENELSKESDFQFDTKILEFIEKSTHQILANRKLAREKGVL